MKSLKYRIGLAFCVVIAQAGLAQEKTKIRHAAFLCAETVYNSELMAPYDVLQHSIFRDSTDYILPFIVTEDGKPFTTFEGIRITPHYSFENSPRVDILVVPSTGNSLSSDLQDTVYINWLRKTAMQAEYVITVCDGAFPLAETGLLDGRKATTFPGDRKAFAERYPKVEVLFDKNFVMDGKYITSVGGALSYEPAFYLVQHIYSKAHADRSAQGLVWDWNLSKIPHLIVAP